MNKQQISFHHFHRNELAFSLIEMLVVLAIVALIAAISMPAFRKQNEHSLNAISLRLTSDLRATRSKAISTRKTETISFDPQGRRYFSIDRKIDRVFPPDLSLTITSAQLFDRQTQNVIAFFSDGSSSGGAITLEFRGVKSVISTNWLSGAVTHKRDRQ